MPTVNLKTLNSVHNPLIKHLYQLTQKSKIRRQEQLCVVEGHREVIRAISQGYVFTHFFMHQDSPKCTAMIEQIQQVQAHSQQAHSQQAHFLSCSDAIFNKVTYRGIHAHIIGIAQTQVSSWQQIEQINTTLPYAPSILVLSGVEKPGNLGAILRTVNALHIQAVLVCDHALEIHHPNVIRNSLGAVFDLPIIQCSSQEALQYLLQNNYHIYVTHMEGTHAPYDLNFREKHCIVMGAEDKGVSQVWKDEAERLVCIPMQGVVDSLNVSVAAAMMMYEVKRQRTAST